MPNLSDFSAEFDLAFFNHGAQENFASYCFSHENEIRKKSLDAWKQYEEILDGAVFNAARFFNDPTALRVGLRSYYSHWLKSYVDLIKDIRSAGYTFKNLDSFHPDDNHRQVAFMRYDIHPWDLAPAFGMMDVNLSLDIPSVFYINWDFGEQEVQYRDNFLLLKKMAASELVSFGLHASPISTWFIFKRFGGHQDRFVAWLFNGFGEWGRAILNGVQPPPGMVKDSLEVVLKGGKKTFKRLAKDFRRHFPDARTVAAHGDTLATRLFKIKENNPDFEPIFEALYSESFLNANNQAVVKQNGFVFESINPTGGDSKLIHHIGDGLSGPDLRRKLLAAMGQKQPFILTIHPSKAHRRVMQLPRLIKEVL